MASLQANIRQAERHILIIHIYIISFYILCVQPITNIAFAQLLPHKYQVIPQSKSNMNRYDSNHSTEFQERHKLPTKIKSQYIISHRRSLPSNRMEFLQESNYSDGITRLNWVFASESLTPVLRYLRALIKMNDPESEQANNNQRQFYNAYKRMYEQAGCYPLDEANDRPWELRNPPLAAYLETNMSEQDYIGAHWTQSGYEGKGPTSPRFGNHDFNDDSLNNSWYRCRPGKPDDDIDDSSIHEPAPKRRRKVRQTRLATSSPLNIRTRRDQRS